MYYLKDSFFRNLLVQKVLSSVLLNYENQENPENNSKKVTNCVSNARDN